MDTLVLTGWGWKEYAVAAAVALKALGGKSDVMGMSKRRLPEFLELEGRNWKRIFLVGLSLGGDEARLATALKALKRTKVTWISSLPMSESQERLLAPLLDVRKADGGLFDGSLVKAVGDVFGVDVAPFLPFAVEGGKIPKSVPRYHELICAAMYAYRNYRDEKSYPMAIRYLAEGVREDAWSKDAIRIVEHWQRYGSRELIGNSPQRRELRERINFVAANPDARVLILGVVLFAAAAVLLVRLFSLQFLHSEEYSESYMNTTRKEVSIPAQRGNIYDRNGVLLAGNEVVYSVTMTDWYYYTKQYDAKGVEEKLHDSGFTARSARDPNGYCTVRPSSN